MGMDIQEHLKKVGFTAFLLSQICAHMFSQQLNFMATALLVGFYMFVLRKEVAVHVFTLDISPIVADDYSIGV
jgi:hypothetical protein